MYVLEFVQIWPVGVACRSTCICLKRMCGKQKVTCTIVLFCDKYIQPHMLLPMYVNE